MASTPISKYPPSLPNQSLHVSKCSTISVVSNHNLSLLSLQSQPFLVMQQKEEPQADLHRNLKISISSQISLSPLSFPSPKIKQGDSSLNRGVGFASKPKDAKHVINLLGSLLLFPESNNHDSRSFSSSQSLSSFESYFWEQQIMEFERTEKILTFIVAKIVVLLL